MNDTRTLTGDELVEEVSALVEGIFGTLKPVVAGAEAILNSTGPVQAADLDGLRPQIAKALGGLIVGAGFIAAPDTLDDQRFGFEWWTGNGQSEPAQVFISLDPNSERFLDYTRQSWFTVPRDSGRRHITGPYVDYLCTDTYTLTFTIPVRRNGKFAGVVGADVVVRELERTVQHKLRALRGRAALVNSQSRVIASNNARQATGSLVRNPDIPSWWASGASAMADAGVTLRRCGDSTIALLVTV